MGSEKVMSQADIDALVAAAPEREAPPAGAAATAEQAATASEETPAAAPEPRAEPTTHEKEKEVEVPVPRTAREATPSTTPRELESLRTTVADLMRRVQKIEAALSILEQVEKTMAEAKALAQQTPLASQDMANQLQTMSNQLEDISAKLLNTPSYDIGGMFQCKSCDSEGFVAIRVKCTDCGEERWWGWWPQAEQ